MIKMVHVICVLCGLILVLLVLGGGCCGALFCSSSTHFFNLLEPMKGLILFLYVLESWASMKIKKLIGNTVLAISIAGVAPTVVISDPMPYGIIEGRLQLCKARSNCISTSSINSIDKYSSPWVFRKTSDEEFDDIIAAISTDQFLKVVESDKESKYIHAEAKSAFADGIDDVEFLLNDRDKIITYRSNSRVVAMAGTVPIGDGGSNRNRLEAIKKRLGVSDMSRGGGEDLEDLVIPQPAVLPFLDAFGYRRNQPEEINFLDNSVPDNISSE